MALTIDQLEIQIATNAGNATTGIDRLASSLQKLGGSLTFNSKLSTFAKNIEKIAAAVNKLDSSRISALASSLSAIASVGKINLTSTINQLKKIPEVAKEFNTIDMGSFTSKLTDMANALMPLNTQLNSVKSGLSKLPQEVNKVVTAQNKYTNSANKASNSTQKFTDKLVAKISKWRTLSSAFMNVARKMGDWFNESNDYIETLNLFNVTMGEGADAAYEYAESVQKLIGIDIAEWMQYQGTFKQLTSGFGVASEQANIMSQNLTQLSYDLASFFNTDVETAFDKLSSAMSGQVKGLREFGIDTTVASLQEYALARGIDKKVRSMTQAEKSLLRYNYIMEKSVIIQGDMARTLVTPSNAMRILTAQLTQMKRALGNIVSVLVAKFIPYIQAMVRVVTDAANAIAKFFGFELPTIDYSGLDTGGFAEDLSDAEDSIGGTADTLKEIKKQLMGFDELNIISNPDTDSSSSGSSDSSGLLGGMEVEEYDFLKGLDTSKVDEIYNKVKKFLSPLKKIWDYLDDYEDTLKTIAGIIAGFAIVKGLKKVGTALAALVGLKFVDYFLDGFKFIKVMGGNFFQNFRGGLDMIRQNLTGVQKAGITAVAALVGFVTIKDSVKALALGCEDVGAKIATITVALGAMGVAMYAALGPWGLLLAAIVAVTGALVGVAAANQEMMSQMVSDAFYDGVGVKITDLVNHFKSLMDSIVATNQPILDNKATIDEASKSIDGAKSSIEYLITSYERGIISTEEFSTQVAENLKTLQSSVKTTMDAIYNNIIYALSTSLGDAVEEAGGSVQEYLTIIGKIKEDGDTLYGSLVDKQNELSTKFANGKISSKEYAEGLREINEKMSALSGATSTVTVFTDKIEGLRKTVNWENEDARTNAFNTIHNSAADAKSAVNESCDEIKRNLETMKLWTTDQEALAALDELLLGNEESRKKQLAEVDNAINTMYDNIQTDVLAGIDNVSQVAAAKWDSMNGWQRFWSGSGSEAEYVSKAIMTYRKDFVQPMSKDIQSSMDELGTKGTTWATAAVDEIMQNAFSYSANGAGPYVSGYSKSLGDDVKEALTSAGKDATAGYQNGVLTTISGVENAFTKMATDAISSVAEAQDSHSPAKEYISLAQDAVDGYTKGVKDNFHYIKDAFVDKFEQLFTELKALVSKKIKDTSELINGFSVTGFNKSLDSITTKAKSVFSSSTWAGYANNITNALAKIKMPTFRNIGLSVAFDTWVSTDKEKVYKALGLSGWPKLNWYTYASGGFPSVGEMFIAREAGPELVGNIGRKTAVANNDQIVSGIESGVYRAMVAANANRNSGGTQTIRIINEIDGDVVGEKVIQYHNGKVIQTGVSPLLV